MTTATATKEAKASAPPAKPKPDLTMARDPALIWPDATACPDFPLGGRDGALTRAEAEDRLRQLSARLNGDGPLRAPSEAERAKAKTPQDAAWIGSPDFVQVCILAEVNPEAVLRAYAPERFAGRRKVA